MNNREVDFICVGEGEISFSKLLNYLELGNTHYADIPGLVYGDIEEPEIGKIKIIAPRFIDNLDEIGMPAWDLLEYKKGPGRSVITSRGCPYHCTHCYNSTMLEMFKEFRYRRRSVKSVIEECVYLKNEGVTNISFADDLFLINKTWIEEFASQYKKNVNIPFGCTARPEAVVNNYDSIVLLMGCRLESIWIGIESGSKRVRKVLGRKIDNRVIVKAFNIARKLNILTKSYNMVGIPSESYFRLY